MSSRDASPAHEVVVKADSFDRVVLDLSTTTKWWGDRKLVFLTRVLERGETASVIMRITAVRASDRACTLSAPATSAPTSCI